MQLISTIFLCWVFLWSFFICKTFEILRSVRATKVVFYTVKWQTFVENWEGWQKMCSHTHIYLITFSGIWKSFVLIKYSLINVHLFYMRSKYIFQSVNNCFRKFEYIRNGTLRATHIHFRQFSFLFLSDLRWITHQTHM